MGKEAHKVRHLDQTQWKEIFSEFIFLISFMQQYFQKILGIKNYNDGTGMQSNCRSVLMPAQMYTLAERLIEGCTFYRTTLQGKETKLL